MRRWVLVLALLLPAVADARSEKTVHSTAARVFPAAVRFLRIDEGVKVLEKDAEAGYVIFELTDDAKTFRGALEVVTVSEKDVRIVITIDDRPSYVESAMLERLEQKLKRESE
jgi:hypothetical protein